MTTFWKVCPGGNPTILLPASEIPPAFRSAAAGECMDPLHIGCEQVGFIDFGRPGACLPRLDMMGGEMCVNATRGFALVLALENHLPETGPATAAPKARSSCRQWSGQVEVSGADAPVTVGVEEIEAAPRGAKHYHAWACLDFDTLPIPIPVEPGVDLVRLPGISHLVITGMARPAPSELNSYCADIRTRHGLEQDAASGCIWLETTGTADSIFPAVWVRDTRSLCLESACGSGTLAAALVLRSRKEQDTFKLRQPGGDTLTVDLLEGNGRHQAKIGGPARLTAQGRLTLDSLTC